MDRLLPVVSSLFADLSAASWPEALRQAAPVFDASVLHVWVRRPQPGEILLDVMNAGRDLSLIDEYQSHFADQDVRLPRLPSLQGRTEPCWRTVDPADFDRTDVVRGYLDRRDVDLRWSLGTGFTLDGGLEIIAGAARGRAMGSFSLAEARLFDHLALNLRNAIDVKLRLDEARQTDLTVNRAGAAASKWSIVMDVRGKVLFATAGAEQALSAGAVFRVEQGKIRMASPSSERRMEKFIARLESAPGIVDSETWFEGDPAFRISMSMLPGTEADGLTSLNLGRSAILVMVEGPVGGRTASAMLAERGLSLAEREVALSIVAGQSVREIALEKQRSVETIRSQLKSVMAKLGVNRQSDIVRFVSGSRI